MPKPRDIRSTTGIVKAERRQGKTVLYLVAMACGYQNEFARPAPKLGEVIWCPRCRKYESVVQAPAAYSSSCQRCSYRRVYRLDLEAARTQANQHLIARPTHAVTIRNGSVIVETIKSNPDELPERNQPLAEVAKVAQENQKKLREFLKRG